MNDLVNSFKSAALSVGEMLTPVLRESKFKETGVLTPEEFVAAGDHLVHHCPTWSWSAAGDSSRTKDYLPPNKQFLITRRVPCHQRCGQMDYDSRLEKIINESTQEGGEADEWVDTHFFETTAETTDKQKEDAETEDSNQLEDKEQEATQADSDEDDDEGGNVVDMDSFLESGAIEDEDPNLYITYKNDTKSDAQNDVDGEALVSTRTYDLHITYDKYYQVPRFWLIGYNEQGKPLTVEQMKEDFSQDHADKTITLESHPQMSNMVLATIHPCRHAAVMKRLIEQFTENGKELSVLHYLYIFLKFVQAVIPTVEYDYTRSIQL
ncbi:autophagocytosis associated protein, active-site domain-containing protein [Ditylenchus destructor]|uniref:Ubiquitin-like-conjugating enzyme ATG3 n=1 Tax=Ditylenchus destructor TaxID=166010 RepID=A0AAD4NE62_9BILA|nr:autophagocytosis associated protein, active-site domain-containing protein [Ditylenchus destructor]